MRIGVAVLACLVPTVAGAAPSLFVSGGDATYLEDEATGAITPLANPAGATSAAPQLQALTTDPVSGDVYGVDLGNFPTEVDLIAFDRAGRVTSSLPITYLGATVTLADGLAFAPDGRLFVAFHADDDPRAFQSGHLGVLDPDTAAIDPTTVVALSGGTQNDGDAIEWVGRRLYLADFTATVGTFLFTVDTATGALTPVGEVSDGATLYQVVDLAWDGRRLFAETIGSDLTTSGRLIAIDPANAHATLIGPAAGRVVLDGITVAPARDGDDDDCDDDGHHHHHHHHHGHHHR